MKRFVIVDGQEVLTTNIEWMQDCVEDSIQNRFIDYFTEGVVPASTGTAFAFTDNGDGTFSIGDGVAYDEDGNRIAILSTDTTDYDSTLPDETTPDNLDGDASTPKSTGCKNIPIADGSTKYIGIKYLLICDSNTPTAPTNYIIHSKSNKRLFYKWDDGYEIEVKDNVYEIEGVILGIVSRIGSTIGINYGSRPSCSLRGEVLLLTTDLIEDGAITAAKLGTNSVTAAKLASSVAGDGLSLDTDGSIKVNVDNSTLAINSDTLIIKSGGVGEAQLNTAAVGNNKLSSAASYNSAVTRYLTLGIGHFVPRQSSPAWDIGTTYGGIVSSDDTSTLYVQAGVNLPNGATVVSVKAYWYCDDALAEGEARIYRDQFTDYGAGATAVATVDSNVTTGNHVVEDTTSFIVDNSRYSYRAYVKLNPNNDKGDIRFFGLLITYTILYPLP